MLIRYRLPNAGRSLFIAKTRRREDAMISGVFVIVVTSWLRDTCSGVREHSFLDDLARPAV